MKTLSRISINLLLIFGGVIAFNLIIGVFGMNEAIGSLIAFILFACFVARRPQPEEE